MKVVKNFRKDVETSIKKLKIKVKTQKELVSNCEGERVRDRHEKVINRGRAIIFLDERERRGGGGRS